MNSGRKLSKTEYEYGNVEVKASDMTDANTKVRITTYIDLDVRKWLDKVSSSLEGDVGYQTVINMILKDAMNAYPAFKEEAALKNSAIVSALMLGFRTEMIRVVAEFPKTLKKKAK